MEWRRVYLEIDVFEAQLVDAGYVLVKCWLHISTEEQLARFEDRQNNPFKQYKLTPEDSRRSNLRLRHRYYTIPMLRSTPF